MLIGLVAQDCQAGSAPSPGKASAIELSKPNNPFAAEALASRIKDYMNTLVDFTQTMCLGIEEQEAISFIVVAEKKVFQVEAAKKPYLLGLAGVVGGILNKEPKVKVGKVYVSDSNLMAQHRSYVFDAAVAKDLQARVKADKLDLDDMYSELLKSMKEYAITRTRKIAPSSD